LLISPLEKLNLQMGPIGQSDVGGCVAQILSVATETYTDALTLTLTQILKIGIANVGIDISYACLEAK